MKTAVLFITWNRLDTTKQVFEQIKIAKPSRLYLASDGAREDVEGEAQKIQEVRNYILNNIDWDCQIKQNFQEKNLGCGKNISQAITWFFENEEMGIILEDDCTPSQSFFSYCEELLEKYKDDKRIWHIAGHSYIDKKNTKETYWFGNMMMCWGWAGWADRWKHYKFDLSSFDTKDLKKFSTRHEVQEYFHNILNAMNNHEIDTWDYQWTFWIVANQGLTINPYKNLTTNIGVEGVHYSGDNPHLNTERYELDKIVHPEKIELNNKMTDELYTKGYNIKKRYFSFFIKKKKEGNKRIITLLGFIKISYKKH